MLNKIIAGIYSNRHHKAYDAEIAMSDLRDDFYNEIATIYLYIELVLSRDVEENYVLPVPALFENKYAAFYSVSIEKMKNEISALPEELQTRISQVNKLTGKIIDLLKQYPTTKDLILNSENRNKFNDLALDLELVCIGDDAISVMINTIDNIEDQLKKLNP